MVLASIKSLSVTTKQGDELQLALLRLRDEVEVYERAAREWREHARHLVEFAA